MSNVIFISSVLNVHAVYHVTRTHTVLPAFSQHALCFYCTQVELLMENNPVTFSVLPFNSHSLLMEPEASNLTSQNSGLVKLV